MPPSIPQFVPLTDAYERLVNFARRFGEPHVTLAMHAAVPLGLTPELTHFLRVYFAKSAPQIAEADLLLSPLCREVGGGLYEMYPEVRELLLEELREDEAFGAERINEVAEFLMVFATSQFRRERQTEARNFLVAQQWTALAQLRPAEAAREMAAALKTRLSAQNPAGSLRIAQLTRTLTTELMGQDDVLLYATGIERLALGDTASAQEVFDLLGPQHQMPTVNSIALPAPAELVQLWPVASKDADTTATTTPTVELPPHITLRAMIPGINEPVTQAAWSPDGKLLAFTTGGSTIHLWDMTAQQMLEPLLTEEEVRCFAWSSDNIGIAAGSSNNFWISHVNATDTPELRHSEAPINDLIWSPDRRWLALATEDGTIRVRDTRIWRENIKLEASAGAARCLCWSPAGASYLMAGYANGEIIMWDTNDWRRRRAYHGHADAINCLAIAPNRVFIASGSTDGTIRLWRADESAEEFQWVWREHSAPVINLCFSPDGKLLASKASNGELRLWDIDRRQAVALIDASAPVTGQPPASLPVLAFHPSEPLLATCVADARAISILALDQAAIRGIAQPATEPVPPVTEPVATETATGHQEIHIAALSNGDLEFTAVSAGTPLQAIVNASQLKLIDQLIIERINSPRYDEKFGVTLFELLLPKAFKELFERQLTLLLVLDSETARYPWELLTSPSGLQPFVLEKGLIRQSQTALTLPQVQMTTDLSALIIGDPLSNFSALPGASREAEAVATILSQYFGAARITAHIGPQNDATTIITTLFAREYNILHLTGHGTYLPDEPTPSGLVLNNDLRLTATELRQLRTIPNLVFINFCHLGQLDSQSRQLQLWEPHRMAASFAEELIGMGVKAVVVAGWAVDDAAALTFAEAFYNEFLSGHTFGESVLRARQLVREHHRDVNTWAAYQCYGDPNFTLPRPQEQMYVA